MQLINEAEILNTWSPIIEQQGVTEPSKISWMSKYCHYHSLNENFSYPQASLLNTPGMGNVQPPSIVSGGSAGFYSPGAKGSGDKFPSLLPLAIQVAARTVGFDIVPVIPMQGPSGVLTYLDYAYTGGRDANAPGIPNKDGSLFKDKALIFKLNTKGFSPDALNLWTQANVGQVYAFSKEDTYTAGALTSPSIVVAYIGRSRIDGFPIFRTLSEASALKSAGGVVDVNVAMNQTQGISFSSIFDASTTVPIHIHSVGGYVKTSGSYTTASLVPGTATFLGDYYVELVKAIEDHIFGYDGSGPQDESPFSGNAVDGRVLYEPMRRGVGETTYYRNMGLTAFTKFVEVETFQASITITTEQMQDLNRQYGIDVVGLVESQLVNQISHDINKHILSKAFALGWQNHYNFLQVEGVNLNLTLNVLMNNPTTTGGAEFVGADGSLLTIPLPAYQQYGSTGATFENQGTFQRRIQSKVLAAGNVITQRGRRGPANFIVTNLQIATALQDSAQFTMYPLANTVNQTNGSLYPLGAIAGMTIYVDPNMAYHDTRILVGRKGSDEEPGLKFMPYLMAETIQTIVEGTMAPKIAVKTRYKLVEAGHHPETHYFTLLVNLKNVAPTQMWHTVPSTFTVA